ncbi:MAG: D-glycerate dehydrogenase, partial [Actinomycetota bacterium]|nr:D-glycerate dehydrogenase [Actinomycetota bacterium]
AVARRARGFDMRILYHDAVPRPDLERELGLVPAEIEPLLRESDFVSLHVPLTPETHHLIGERQLGMMKTTAVLINTSRGPVVDAAALYRALKAGRPAAAALDVTEIEPISADDPLLTLENVTIAPHIASGSSVTRARMADIAVANLLAGLAGQTPPNCLNPAVSGHQRRRRG